MQQTTSTWKEIKKYQESYKGPYPVTKVQINKTVNISHGAVKYHTNIRMIKPYQE